MRQQSNFPPARPEALFVTIALSAEFYDCTPSCHHLVVQRNEPSFQTAILPFQLHEIKAAIRKVSPPDISFSEESYELSGNPGIKVTASYDPNAMSQTTVSQLFTTAQDAVDAANKAYQRATVRARSTC